MVTITCPRCGSVYDMGEDFTGGRTECGECGHKWTAVPSIPPAEQIDVECPHCGGQVKVAKTAIGKSASCPDCNNEFEVINPNLRPCPSCFAMISKRAQACPQCGTPIGSSKLQNAPQTASASAPVVDDYSSEKDILVCRPSLKNYIISLTLATLFF